MKDYYMVFLSRQLSVLGRKEVHLGRAPFGIFGDGKELAQIAYVKSYRDGDWRSGYYRDQTFMLAAGMMTPTNFSLSFMGIPIPSTIRRREAAISITIIQLQTDQLQEGLRSLR